MMSLNHQGIDVMKRFLMAAAMLVLPLIQAHALTIGTKAHYPPFSSLANKNNNFVGFDVDIMQAICKQINMPCTYIPITVNDLKGNLMAGSIDLAIAAIVIPDEPSPYFLFSLPYLESYAQFVVNTESRIKTLADIKYKMIGTRSEPLYSELLHKLYGDKTNIKEYQTLDDLMAALSNRDVDIVFTNAAAINYWIASGGGQYRLIGDKIPIGNGFGIMANAGQETLIERVNQAIKQMMNDGSYAKIYSRYFAEYNMGSQNPQSRKFQHE